MLLNVENESPLHLLCQYSHRHNVAHIPGMLPLGINELVKLDSQSIWLDLAHGRQIEPYGCGIPRATLYFTGWSLWLPTAPVSGSCRIFAPPCAVSEAPVCQLMSPIRRGARS